MSVAVRALLEALNNPIRVVVDFRFFGVQICSSVKKHRLILDWFDLNRIFHHETYQFRNVRMKNIDKKKIENTLVLYVVYASSQPIIRTRSAQVDPKL